MKRILIWLLLVFIALLILYLPVASAQACLSKREARAIWPRAHLYWHSANHCWDNRRGGRRYHGIMFASRAEAPKKPPPPIVRPKEEREEDFCCWPPLDSLTLFADRWPEEWRDAK
jgi:hypothetical protein